MKYLLIL